MSEQPAKKQKTEHASASKKDHNDDQEYVYIVMIRGTAMCGESEFVLVPRKDVPDAMMAYLREGCFFHGDSVTEEGTYRDQASYFMCEYMLLDVKDGDEVHWLFSEDCRACIRDKLHNLEEAKSWRGYLRKWVYNMYESNQAFKGGKRIVESFIISFFSEY